MKVTCEPKHIRTVNSDKTSKLAYASITLDDAFVVHGLSIINGREGLFVSMPQNSYKDGNGNTKYSDVFHAVTAEARTELNDKVMDAYEQAIQEQQQEDETAQEGETDGLTPNM